MAVTEAVAPKWTPPAEGRLNLISLDRTLMAGWCLIAIAMLTILAYVLFGRFSADAVLLKAISYLLIVGACGAVLRGRGWLLSGTAAEIFAQFMLGSMLASLVSVVLASTSLPYADDALQTIDRSLFGTDWHTIAGISRQMPNLSLVLSYAYTSLTWQPALLMTLLVLCGRVETAKTFCVAWVIALGICVVVFPFVPAVGGYLHNHVTQAETHVLVAAAWRHVEILGPAREGTLRLLNTATLEGIITFPSFHTAAGILLVWGFWHLRHLRWIALALNVLMLASAPVVGGHYLIDVVAGGVVAGLALVSTRTWQRGSGWIGKSSMANNDLVPDRLAPELALDAG